jgi:hypothetical protein
MKAFRIKDWSDHYENNRSKELKRPEWFPCPNSFDGTGFMELMDHPAGLSHYGAWILLLAAASRMPERGVFITDSGYKKNVAMTIKDIARMVRGPARVFEEAALRLLEIGWIEEVEILLTQTSVKSDGNAQSAASGADAEGRTSAEKSQPSAGIPQQGATMVPQKGKGNREGEGRKGNENKKENREGERTHASTHEATQPSVFSSQISPPCPSPVVASKVSDHPESSAGESWFFDLPDGKRSLVESAIFLSKDTPSSYRRDLNAAKGLVDAFGFDRVVHQGRSLVVSSRPPFASKLRAALEKK